LFEDEEVQLYLKKKIKRKKVKFEFNLGGGCCCSSSSSEDKVITETGRGL
jgi:hypothetical protein